MSSYTRNTSRYLFYWGNSFYGFPRNVANPPRINDCVKPTASLSFSLKIARLLFALAFTTPLQGSPRDASFLYFLYFCNSRRTFRVLRLRWDSQSGNSVRLVSRITAQLRYARQVRAASHLFVGSRAAESHSPLCKRRDTRTNVFRIIPNNNLSAGSICNLRSSGRFLSRHDRQRSVAAYL